MKHFNHQILKAFSEILDLGDTNSFSTSVQVPVLKVCEIKSFKSSLFIQGNQAVISRRKMSYCSV